MITMIVAHSEDPDSGFALTELIEQGEAQLEGKVPQAGIMYAGEDFDYSQLLNGIVDKWPNIELIGCTTVGEISSTLGYVEDSVSLSLFCADNLDIKAGIARNLSADVAKSCQQATEQAFAKSEQSPALCVALPESLTTDAAACVTTLKSCLGDSIDLVGALAADQFEFQSTQQFYGREVLTDAMPILVFSGDLTVAIGRSSGWKPIGEPGIITKSDGNTLLKINELSALDFYRNLLGEQFVPTGDRPLAFIDDEGKVSYLRAPLQGSHDEASGSITFFGSTPVGKKVQLTVATNDTILNAAHTSLESALQRYPQDQQPDGVLVFSCAARKQILGTKTAQEAVIITNNLKSTTPFSGFYAYGEIDGSHYHNETCLIALIGEH